ncbi:MAG: YfhO family protein [Bacteroidales bacterium]|nr:YfhO family protein [Bacteroidales bacterium]MDD2263440.1 YfhO family protein [Bacteroidales bacterium]MDD2830770.1 YfhO family protein [Bacteroidales bacterium]MDD3207969.1 YfhO family protein [Bacteroidales bacterium]MDD3696524.1 YfhO family protein [Bacteroidales bacterium]
MQKIAVKKWIAYPVAVLSFLVISYGFVPQVFQGKVLNQGDITAWQAMAKEAGDYNKTHDDEALWTNSMFSGMPTVTINKITRGNYTQIISRILEAGVAPASYLFLSLLGGFLLFLALGINPWVAMLGGVAMTFCSYNMQIIQTGHVTKMIAIAYMPWVLASIAYAYRKNALLGALFCALTVSLHVAANHPQITYYLGFILLFVIAGLMAEAIIRRRFPHFAKTTVLIIAAGLLGLATSANHLLPTYEYTRYSMRGGSELGAAEGKSSGTGLDLDYATQWSYSRMESFNMMIPDFYGGASVGPLDKDSQTYKKLTQMGYNADGVISNMPLYWGEQPFTAGPMYMGAIMVFLFVLGLILIKGPVKWALAVVCLLSLLLSWGYHLEWFSLFFFRYIPLYDKFRTVSMILVIWQMVVPALGIYTLWHLLENQIPVNKAIKAMYWALGITTGFCLVTALIPALVGSFTGPADRSLPGELIPALTADRKGLLRQDALRSAALILGTAAVIWLSLNKKIKQVWAIGTLGLLLLVDYLPVGKRYLNESHFISRSAYQNRFAERPVDKYIRQNNELYYRVLDLTGSPFNDATASYHHKSIGGYNAAKLQRYQDVIERHLMPEMQYFIDKLRQCQTLEEASEIFAYQGSNTGTPVMNMLNTRYIILTGDGMPVVNPYALGNAWVVSSIHPVTGPAEEIESISRVDLGTTAVMQDPPEKWIRAAAPAESTVSLTSYSPNTLEYSASMEKDGIVVFGEIFYPKGWKAKIDGNEVPILRSNYITRTLYVPEGEHQIRFTYLPSSYTTGIMISRISSSALLLSLLAAVVTGCVGMLRKKREKGM